MKLFDVKSNRIILVSYPAGGFGNFILHVLTEYTKETVKVDARFRFSTNGNSHSTNKYTNIYYHDPGTYIPSISVDPKNNRILVLCDNGIINDSYDKLSIIFPNAQIVRVIIDDAVRPIIYKTCITKALLSDVLTETTNQVIDNWGVIEDYAVRENFTLLYHQWPFHWNASSKNNVINVSLENLINNPVDTISETATALGLTIRHKDKLTKFCNEWTMANKQYFEVYTDWAQIDRALTEQKSIPLTHITNIHDQGYINYCIERKFNVIIPVYDYKEWFSNTQEILDMVEKFKYV
jgi:hypothetical protein